MYWPDVFIKTGKTGQPVKKGYLLMKKAIIVYWYFS